MIPDQAPAIMMKNKENKLKTRQHINIKIQATAPITKLPKSQARQDPIQIPDPALETLITNEEEKEQNMPHIKFETQAKRKD